MTGDGRGQPAAGEALEIVAGHPSAEELAALTVALSAVLATHGDPATASSNRQPGEAVAAALVQDDALPARAGPGRLAPLRPAPLGPRRRGTEGQPVTTSTSPIPRGSTGALICDASPTRIVTRRFSGKAAMTAAVASAVPVSARRVYS